MDEPYKSAILAVCAPVERPPLEEAPLPEFDLGKAQVCPACGGLNALVAERESGEICQCPDCECSFTPRVESLSRQVIRKLTARRESRRAAAASMIERLSTTPPKGMDPVDYLCFRNVVDGSEEEPDPQALAEVPQ